MLYISDGVISIAYAFLGISKFIGLKIRHYGIYNII